MSKPVKEMICQELTKTFAGVDAVMVVDPTRLDGITANALRRDLASARVRMLLVKNSLTKRALAGTKLGAVGPLLEGACALAWGGESIVDVAKLLVAKVKTMPNLVIRGAVMEGNALVGEQAIELSKMPTKAELRSSLVGLALSPGRKLAAAILSPGNMIANLLKGRIETLEKNEPAPAPAPAAA
jgi:large subunit ribosomal protein L10